MGTLLNYIIKDFNEDHNLVNLYNDKNFSNLKLISSGSYGDIYSAYSIKDKIEVCLKKINIEKMKLNYESNNLENYQKDLDNEINILDILSDNKNSVKFFGNYDNENEKIIVMEKCDQNLYEFIKKRGKALTVEEIKLKFEGLNELFKSIQRKDIIHRDLKLENFLIKYNKEKTDYVIKLGDYGIGKFKYRTNGIYSGLKGTIDTIAPEIILEKTKKYKSSVDMFSLGIILYQLSHNLKHPYGKNLIEFVSKYKDNYDKDNLEIDFDKSIKNNDFKDLVKKMIKLNPKNRLSWENYFKHPFFKK
jgi:serine/threonine protein kinase